MLHQKLVQCCVAALILGSNCFLLAGCTAQTANAPHTSPSASVPAVIIGINSPQFFKAVGMTPVGSRAVYPIGINYYFRISGKGITGVSLGVFPSVQLAKTTYDTPILVARTIDTEIHHTSTKGIGDRFTCFYSRAYQTSGGITSPGGNINLMRRNVIINMDWLGSYEEGIRFARKLDQVLQTSQTACPKGAKVPVPVVAFDMPKSSFLITLQNAGTIKYHTEDGTRIYTDADLSQAAKSSGSFRPDSRAPQSSTGTVQKTTGVLHCATLTNVIFTASYTLAASRVGPVPLHQVIAWNIPGNALYFRNMAQEDNLSADANNEWIQLRQGTYWPVADADRLKEAAIADIAKVVERRWQPTPDVISVFSDHSTTVPQMIYSAAYTLDEYRVIYLGVIGKRIWQLIERQSGMKNSSPLPSVAEIIRSDAFEPVMEGPDVLYSKAEITSNAFTRLQANAPNGPYEPVNIRLTRYAFPTNLDLKSSGYPIIQLQVPDKK